MASSILPNHFVCLPQALVFKYVFRKEPNLTIKFGVQKEGNQLVSHAWVQQHDSILIGNLPAFNYIPIWEL